MKRNSDKNIFSMLLIDTMRPAVAKEWNRMRKEYHYAGYRLILLSLSGNEWKSKISFQNSIPGKDLSSLLFRVQLNELEPKELLPYLTRTGCGEFTFPALFRSDSPERFPPYAWRQLFTLVFSLVKSSVEPTVFLICCRTVHKSVIREALPFTDRATLFTASADNMPQNMFDGMKRDATVRKALIGAPFIKERSVNGNAILR